MRILAPAVLVLALPAAAAAQESAAFLKIGVGARAVGMGGAFTAVADDVNAIAWNPAGLAAVESRGLGLTHTQHIAGTRFNFLGLVQPTRWGTFAAAGRHLSQGSMDGRDAQGRPTGSFRAADGAVELAYGLRIFPGALLGCGVKYISSKIAEASARSYAVDLGTLYELAPLGPGVPRLGLAVLNIGPGMRFLEERTPLPLTLAVGLGYRLPVGLTLALDYRHRANGDASEVSVGTEYLVLPVFAVRAGYGSGKGLSGGTGVSRLTGLAGGFGLRIHGYHLDYSITPFGELGNVQRFSVQAKF